MAITANVTTVDRGDVTGRTPWIASVYSVDVTGVEIIKAAPASGNLYLEQLDIFTDATAVTITILDVAAILFGPIPITINETNGHIVIKLKWPLKLTGALNIDSGGAQATAVIAQGYTIL